MHSNIIQYFPKTILLLVYSLQPTPLIQSEINLMSEKPTVYIIAGQVGAGKTTFAKKLEQETGAIRFTPDEWILKLFKEIPSNEEFDDYYYRCCNVAWETAKKILEKGIAVVLDFGFWKKAERDKYKEMIPCLGYNYKLYHVLCEADEIKHRLKIRNKQQPEGAVIIDEEAFDFFSPQFEAPVLSENAIEVQS
jgi:predicted kinase